MEDDSEHHAVGECFQKHDKKILPFRGGADPLTLITGIIPITIRIITKKMYWGRMSNAIMKVLIQTSAALRTPQKGD